MSDERHYVNQALATYTYTQIARGHRGMGATDILSGRKEEEWMDRRMEGQKDGCMNRKIMEWEPQINTWEKGGMDGWKMDRWMHEQKEENRSRIYIHVG